MRKTYLGMLVVALCIFGLTGFAMAQELLSNEGFETWTGGAGGPPDSWTLSGDTLLVAAQESGTVRTGSYSVAFTCSTTFTRWLQQSVTVPVADSCYTFSCYAYDNDSFGRARVGIRWFAADDSTVVGSYLSNVYTTDLAAWQQLTTGSQTAPAGAVYAHGEIRIYDENADTNWTHTTLYFDDASLIQTTCPPPSDTLTIPEIQYNVTIPSTGGTDDCYPSPYNTQTKITRGIVTQRGIADGFDDFWIQDADSAWSGIFIFQNTQAPNRGDEVVLTADISEYYGVTEMSNLSSYEVVATGQTVPDPIDIVPGDLAKSYLAGCDVDAEPYECLLVKVSNVIVTSVAPHGYADGFYVTDFAYTDTCQIEYYIYDYPLTPAVGDTFLSITGIVHYSRLEYEINPRDFGDYVPKTPFVPPGPSITGISWTPTLPADNDVLVMASIYEDAKAVINDSVFYQVGDTLPLPSAWTAVAGDSSSDNFHFFTIPGQDPEQVVYFYVYAENDTGVSTSQIEKYITDEEPANVRINEFMYDNVGADAGCFIELYGPSSLSLNGWELIMVNGFDGTDKKIIDLSGFTIPVDGFFVIAQDATVPNYDMINALADFENAPDNIHLRKDGFNYDCVGYGSFDQAEYFMGETWPTYDPGLPYGMSLCRYPDGADNDYNRRDFGVYGSASNTPGTANLAPTEYSIYDIQGGPKTDSPYNTERVIVGGIVTADPVECTYNPGYFIEMSDGGNWSGVLVYDLFYEPARGDSVLVRGTVTEEFNRTQISYVTHFTNLGAGSMPDPHPVTTATVEAGEAVEGILVQVSSVTVLDTLGYGEFLIDDGSDTCMVDDICGYTTMVEPGDVFGYIRGVVDYSFGEFKIQPRDDNDFAAFAPGDLEITKSAGDVSLDWTGVDIAQSYIIIRNTVALDTVAAPTTAYLDAGTTGDTGTNYFYVVQAQYSVGKSDSREVGEFDKNLKHVK